MTSLADLFVAHGHPDGAERLVRERATSTQDTRLLAWLRQHVAARGDLAGALDLALDLFWRRPNLSDYQQVRGLAQQSGRWESVRAD